MGLTVKYHGRNFKDEDVQLDDNEFYGCTFINCTLVFKGGTVGLDNCRVDKSNFLFQDGAARTLAFMGSLFRTGMEPLIERVFDSVRNGQAEAATKQMVDIPLPETR